MARESGNQARLGFPEDLRGQETQGRERPKNVKQE